MLTIPQAAGDDGRLFGSVTAQDIVDAIKQARGMKLDRRKVHLEEPIRTTGTHMVPVEVHEGVTAQIKTIVTAGVAHRSDQVPCLRLPGGSIDDHGHFHPA